MPRGGVLSKKAGAHEQVWLCFSCGKDVYTDVYRRLGLTALYWALSQVRQGQTTGANYHMQMSMAP